MEDVTVWYSQFLANGNTADGLEAHLAEAAATALPPRGDGLESLGGPGTAVSSKGFATEIGVVHAPVRVVPFTGHVDAMLENLRTQPHYQGQMVHVHVREAQAAVVAAPRARSSPAQAPARHRRQPAAPAARGAGWQGVG